MKNYIKRVAQGLLGVYASVVLGEYAIAKKPECKEMQLSPEIKVCYTETKNNLYLDRVEVRNKYGRILLTDKDHDGMFDGKEGEVWKLIYQKLVEDVVLKNISENADKMGRMLLEEAERNQEYWEKLRKQDEMVKKMLKESYKHSEEEVQYPDLNYPEFGDW